MYSHLFFSALHFIIKLKTPQFPPISYIVKRISARLESEPTLIWLPDRKASELTSGVN